jgi:20S proteasome subunit alpha 6
LYEYYCTAIGARSQTANTYLENHIDAFSTMSLDKMIDTAISAMKKAQDIE